MLKENVVFTEQLLHELQECYTISDDKMLSIKLSMHQKEIQKLIERGIHTHKISEPKKKGGMWLTYVKDDTKKNCLKQIQARTETGFYQSLYDWYFPSSSTYKKATLTSLLEEVLDYKLTTLHNSKETIHRLRLDFNKYYENTAFAKKPIVSITKQDCEDFFNPLITTDRKKKDFDNIIGVANAIFSYAVNRLEIIPCSPLSKATLNRKILDKGISESDEDRVYFHDEQEKLFQVITKHLEEENYDKKADLYAILLDFTLGLRISELVALKYSDISYRFNNLYVCRKEQKNQSIVNYTKGYEKRYVALSDYELQIIDAIKKVTKDFLSDEDYIFVNKTGRRHIRALDNTLRDLCDEAGIPQKSFHDIRRTVASELHEQGMVLEDIRVFMGHKDIVTTQGYIYSRTRRTDRAIAIHKAIKGNEANIFKAS